MNPEQLSAIRQQIADSFAGRVRPDAGQVVADAGEHDPEGTELRNAFAGKRWQEVDVAMVAAFKDALPLFTPCAFAYYLPAYLLACLEAPERVDTALDSVLFSLSPPRSSREWRQRFFETRANKFDAAQARAIAAFLDWQTRAEAEDWASAGREPPPERIGAALAYWRQVAGEMSGPR